jgi:hypothetical protein
MKDLGFTSYPDISDILARKAEGRRDIAGRSFGEKVAMVERMRERLAPLKRAREQRTDTQMVQQASTGPRR